MKRIVFAALGFVQLFALEAKAEFLPLTTWQELTPELQRSLSHTRKATFALDFVNGMNCSGTFVSNEGHIMTAQHCLGRCLEDAFKIKGPADKAKRSPLLYHVNDDKTSLRNFTTDEYSNYLENGGPRDTAINTLADDPELFKGLKCDARINGKTFELTYLGGGAGYLMPFFASKIDDQAKHLLPEWMKFATLGFGAGGDFALLKAEIQQTPCIPLSASSTKVNEQLKVLSATMRDGYRHENERLGQTAFFSTGLEATGELASSRKDLPTVYRHAILGADSGSSGSAVLGEDNTVKGILAQAMDVRKDSNYSHTISSFIDINQIRRLLEQTWRTKIPSCK